MAGPPCSWARPGATAASPTTPSPCSSRARWRPSATKNNLPNYGVFDEKRVFAAGPMPEPVSVCGVRLGLPICEDIWAGAVVAQLKKAGAELLVPQRLALRDGQARRALEHRQGARRGDKPAARLSQSGRRPGRARLRRRLVRAERRRRAGRRASRLGGKPRCHALAREPRTAFAARPACACRRRKASRRSIRR